MATNLILRTLSISLFVQSMVNNEKISYDESNLPTDTLTLMSDLPFDKPLNIRQNVSYYCYAKLPCSKLLSHNIKCDDTLPPIQWLLPRNLRDFELTYGANSTRVEFSKQSFASIKDNNYLIRSSIHITDISLIHSGTYTCLHPHIGESYYFNVAVRGGRSNDACAYDDQCESFNCNKHQFNGQCLCTLEKPVYISRIDMCLKESHWSESCEYDEQCSYKKLSNAIKCENTTCECIDGYTDAKIPLIAGKTCLKIVNLEESCNRSEQCTPATTHSFCSSKQICECLSGYRLETISNTKKCVIVKQCDSSKLGFNDNYTRGDCDENEFCRNNVCLCKTNYEIYGDNMCHLKNIYEPAEKETWITKFGYYILGGMCALLLFILILIAWQIIKYKRESKLILSISIAR